MTCSAAGRRGAGSATWTLAVAGCAALITVSAQCPAGSGTNSSGECEQCPPGKHSVNESALCEFCPQTMRPNKEQSRCECASLHFSPWADGGGCTPCAAVPLSRVLRRKHKGLFGDELDLDEDKEKHELTTSAVACTGPSTQVMDLNGVVALPDGEVEVSIPCAKLDHAECPGGVPGSADICPNAGMWLSPTRTLAIKANASERPPSSASERARMFLLRECDRTHGGKPSHCQHWSRCVQAADQGDEPDDPWTPYVSDREFAEWFRQPRNAGKSCTTELANLRGGAGGGWDRVKSDGVNCCAPGFEGELCAYCTPPLMKINGECVLCDGDGWESVRWGKVCGGTFLAFLFAVWVLKKAGTPFEEASGVNTVMVFYFQMIALMFKDRASVLAMPLGQEAMDAMQISFIENTETICMVKLTFWENFYFKLLSPAGAVCAVYFLVIWGIRMSSSGTNYHGVLQTVEQARNDKIAAHVMAHIHLFEAIEPRYREKLIAKLTTRQNLKKGHRLLKEGDKEYFFIVVNGALAIESQGKLVASIKTGQHFGVESLFHRRPVSCTVRVAVDGTAVMSMRRQTFRLVSYDFSEAAKQSMLASLNHDAAEDIRDADVAHLLGAVMSPEDDAADSAASTNALIDVNAEYQPVDRSAPPLTRPELLVFIARNPVFASASATSEKKQALLEIFADNFERKFFDANEIIYRTGEEAKYMYLVAAGAAEVFTTEQQMVDNQEPLLVFDRGRMFGVAALIHDGEHRYDSIVRAKVDLETYRLSKDKMKDLMHDFPDMAEAFASERRKRAAQYKAQLAEIGLAGADADFGEATNMRAVNKQIEMEHQMDETLVASFTKVHRKGMQTTAMVVKHPCCLMLDKITQPIGLELRKVFAAASNPTGIVGGLIEMMIVLYGPTTLTAMGVLFCRESAATDDSGTMYQKTVLVQDSSIECSGENYDVAARIAWFTLFFFCVCVPLVMSYACLEFYDLLEEGSSEEDAQVMAKARHHSSWTTMTPEERDAQVKKCEHELRLELLGNSRFLLTSFQMSVVKEHAHWYPQWHLLRRTFLNYIYMDGLQGGDNTTTFLITPYDWRVVIAFVLVVSSIMQQYFQPFKGEKENALEAWSLHFLTVVTVVDIADEANSVYMVVILSALFAVIAANTWRDTTRARHTAKQSWHRIRRIHVQNGHVSVDDSGLVEDPIPSARQLLKSICTSITAAWPKKQGGLLDERLQQRAYSNPLSRVGDDDSSSDEDPAGPSVGSSVAHGVHHAAHGVQHAAARAASKAKLHASANIEGLAGHASDAVNHLDREALQQQVTHVQDSHQRAVSKLKHVDSVMTKGKVSGVTSTVTSAVRSKSTPHLERVLEGDD